MGVTTGGETGDERRDPRVRDFNLLWTGRAFSTLGTQMSTVAWPLLALGVTGSAALTGVVAAAPGLLGAALLLPAGVVVDRVSRRRLMIGVDLGRAMLLVPLLLGLALGSVSFWLVLCTATLVGGLGSLFGPAESAAVRHLAPRGDVARAHVLNQGRDSATALAGPALGGVLYGLSRAAPFVGDAVSYLVSALAVAAIRTPLEDAPGPTSRVNLKRELAEGFRFMWSQVLLRSTLLAAAGFNFAFSGLMLLVILLAQRGGASAATIGLLLSVVGVGGVAGALASPLLRRITTARRLIPSVCWVGAVTVPFFATTTNPAVLALLLGITTLLGPAANAELFALQVSVTPDELQGRVFSAALFLASCAAPIGPFVAGLLFQHASPWVPGALFSAVMLTVAIVLTRTVRHDVVRVVP